MTQLEQMLEHAKALQEQLATMVEQEHVEHTTRPVMYVFVYEQTYSDAEGWGPNSQHIQAYDIAQAFATLGYVIKEMGLTVRNIRYGRYSEMADELDAISEYRQKREEG